MLVRALLLTSVLQLTNTLFISRRRRAPVPPRVDCSLTSWKTVSSCSEQCGTKGEEKQKRTIVEEGRNGGKPCSDYKLERTISCNRLCYNEGEIDEVNDQCKCPAGWKGDCCDEDVDECAGDEDRCEQVCVNDKGGYHCECESNYTLDVDDKSCKDVKECQKDPAPCDHRCEEKDGGYECYCNKGYELADDGKTCDDVDECQRGSLCEYQCKNIPGDYECICGSGYFRNSDNKTCTDINECNTNNGGCAQSCANTQGGFRCNCTSGYILANNFYDCEDVNECEVYGEYNICEQRCNNILGSYTCSCIPPYVLNEDQRTCYCGSSDSELCKSIKEQAEANRKNANGGDSHDTVYNIIIVVLICICVSLVIGLVIVCGRKGYHRMYPPKLPPLSTMPRFNNAVFNPHLVTDNQGDDDSGSGIYADPDDFCHSPDYMDMTHDPIDTAGKADPNEAEYCPADPANEYENTDCSTSNAPVGNHYTDLPGAQTLERHDRHCNLPGVQTLERHSREQEEEYEQPSVTEYQNNPLYEEVLGDRI